MRGFAVERGGGQWDGQYDLEAESLGPPADVRKLVFSTTSTIHIHIISTSTVTMMTTTIIIVIIGRWATSSPTRQAGCIHA